MAGGHVVDIPITNLDIDDEEFIDSGDLDPSVLQDDFDLDETIGGSPTTNAYPTNSNMFLTNLKKVFGSWGGNAGYSKISKAANGIELRESYRDHDDSFDLSDDEFMIRRQSSTILRNTIKLAKKYTIASIIIALGITVIILSVFVSKKTPSSSNNDSSKPSLSKQTLTNGTHTFYPTTILISLDGFHPHYISSELTPNLHTLLTTSYGTPYMIPSFPSSTFPNHWTIATGLYPENHGIVGNTFYDPSLKRQFINVIPDKSLDPVFWGGESIWETAEKNGVTSAIHMFPGSEVVFPKWNPSEVDKYNGTETLDSKIKRIIGWLDRETSKRPELIIGYVPTIDSLGHHYGIHGKELEEGLKSVDTFIGHLRTSISDRNLTDIVNLVIVSDHGMAPTSNERLIYLDDLLDTSKIQHTDGWPLFGLRPYEKYSTSDIFAELKQNFTENSGYSIYLREDLPSKYKFGGPKTKSNELYYDRIAPIWVIPDIGYSITTHADMERKQGNYSPKGTHGYDNSEVLMRAIFLAEGPFFKSKLSNEKSKKVKPFHNIEVYNILCDTLDIKPASNDGSSNIFNTDNVLDVNWKDSESYPNVKFDIGAILKADSTYNSLYRDGKDKVTTTLENQESETATSDATSDAEKQKEKEKEEEAQKEKEKEDEEAEKEIEKNKEFNEEDYDQQEEDSAKEAAKEEMEYEKEKQELAEEKAKENEAIADTHGMEETHNEDQDKPDSTDKTIVGELEEELEDLAEQFMDDVGELSEDIQDIVEDAYNKFLGDKGTNKEENSD